jgi:hypothetical protein
VLHLHLHWQHLRIISALCIQSVSALVSHGDVVVQQDGVCWLTCRSVSYTQAARLLATRRIGVSEKWKHVLTYSVSPATPPRVVFTHNGTYYPVIASDRGLKIQLPQQPSEPQGSRWSLGLVDLTKSESVMYLIHTNYQNHRFDFHLTFNVSDLGFYLKQKMSISLLIDSSRQIKERHE